MSMQADVCPVGPCDLRDSMELGQDSKLESLSRDLESLDLFLKIQGLRRLEEEQFIARVLKGVEQ